MVTEVDPIVQGHQKCVRISTSPVSSRYQRYNTCEVQFPDDPGPVIRIYIHKVSHGDQMKDDLRGHKEVVVLRTRVSSEQEIKVILGLLTRKKMGSANVTMDTVAQQGVRENYATSHDNNAYKSGRLFRQ
jgi:hypothetical protein